MMKLLNRYILFLTISFVFPGTVYALDAASQSSNVFKFQQKLAAKNNARAQYKLATMYEMGIGIAPSIELAKHWYGQASAAGINAASDRLIYLSIKEQGYDQAKNSAWLEGIKKQAEKSNGDGLFLLAQLHREGLGVNKDLNKALDILDQVSLLGAADVEDERRLILQEIEANKKAEITAQKIKVQETARVAQQEKQQQVDKEQLKKQQQVNKEQLKKQQEEVASASQAAKIRRYEKARMQRQLEQQLIDEQQAWASGGVTVEVDEEF
jgi:TPR repeat protein